MSPARYAAVVGLCLAALLGCADRSSRSASEPSASASASSSTAPGSPAGSGRSPAPGETPGQNVKTIAVTVEDGTVTPKPGRVDVPLGTTVRLEVTSDVADEVHVHGYERELGLRPGETTSLQFVADVPGVFEVETHESSSLLLSLQVR